VDLTDLSWLDIGLGGAVVGGALMLWRAFIQRATQRSDSEGDLDGRAVRLGEIAEQLLEDERIEKRQLLDAERAEKIRLQDALFAAHERHAELAATMLAQNAEQIQRVRAEQREATQHLHKRLDQCLAQHDECRQDHAEALRQIEELRARISATAQDRVLTVPVPPEPAP
jgi:predicted phage tail protein